MLCWHPKLRSLTPIHPSPPPRSPHPAPRRLLALSPPPRSLAPSLPPRSLSPFLYTATLGTVYLTASAVTTTWASLSGVVIWQGFCAALSILAATAYGAGNMKLVGYWLVLCLVVITIACIPIGATWAWAGDIMRVFMGKDTITEQVRGLTNQFGLISTIGLLPLQWSTALNNYLVAQKIVVPQMYAGIFVLGCNVGFNYLFVYGVPSLGWSGLGFAGSPLATAATRWLMCIVLFAFVFGRGMHKPTFEHGLQCKVGEEIGEGGGGGETVKR